MSIEIVKLKNGNEYPLSPAYRAPIVAGTPLEYSFEYNSTAVGTEEVGSLTIVTTPEVGEPTTQTFTLFPLIEDRALTSAELAAVSAKGDSMLGEFVIEDAAIMDTNTLVDMFMLLNDVDMNGATFSGLPGSVAAMSISSQVFTVVSISDSDGLSGSDTETGASVSVTVTAQVPAAGTYWATTVPSEALGGLQGTVSTCTFQLDPRYYGGGVIKICNWLLAAQLQTGQAVNLQGFPRIEEKLIAASLRGIPLAIYFGFGYVMGVSGELYNGDYHWSLANGGTLTFDQTAHTLAYTAGS